MVLPIIWSIGGSIAIYKSIKYLLSDNDDASTYSATRTEVAQVEADLAVARARQEQAERLATQLCKVKQRAVTHALHCLCNELGQPACDLNLLRGPINHAHPLVKSLTVQLAKQQEPHQQQVTTLIQAITALEHMSPTSIKDKELPHA